MFMHLRGFSAIPCVLCGECTATLTRSPSHFALESPILAPDMLFIVNPASASGSTRHYWERARRHLSDRGISFSEKVTESPGHATSLTRDALIAGETRIIAVGGDGTLNEIVSGYLDGEGRPINSQAAIGILPSGTGCDFTRTLKITNATQAIAVIERDKTKLLDVAQIILHDRRGQVRQRYFINSSSFGFGGATAARVNSWRQTLPGWVNGRARFLLAALDALRSYRNRPVRVHVCGNPQLEVLSDLIIVANGRYSGGGMKLAPMADLEDSRLEILIADRVSRSGIIRELPRVWDGGHVRNPRLRITQAGKVDISGDPEMPVEIDGESGGMTPASIEVLPRAVRFIL